MSLTTPTPSLLSQRQRRHTFFANIFANYCKVELSQLTTKWLENIVTMSL